MIRSLQIFYDLVDTRSFTETGRRNFMTQSAVSQHLKALEEKLGHPLIDRRNRQVGLTRAGRMVYVAAREILHRYAQLEAALKKPPREVAGSLRVAATLTVGLYELAPHVTAFLKQHPKIDLQLAYLPPVELSEALLTGRADVGVIAYPDPHPLLKAELFKNDRMVIIVSPKHPWAGRRRVSLTRLKAQPFIAMHSGLQTRRTLDQVLRKAGVSLTPVHEFDNVELIKRAVEVEMGVSVVPRDTVASEVRSGTLRQLEIIEGPIEHPIKILTRRDADLPLPAEKFIQSLLATPRQG
ncbi:MAG: LysR family transcriptional regulator [Candidatus Omnitrophica bacterium CG11_big_fil_rev_8_21_14_0_20_63_9]|nr:MAG: LysR family transcriptional regulator [Candidatus Omnitrophica bacterium CG11_big_fil_rev_8_21_14_0_20_63_9]